MRIDPQTLPPLNREQRKLVRGVVGVVERTAKKIALVRGVTQDFDDMQQHGHMGVIIGAFTFDPSKSDFPHWAGVCAAHAMLEFLRNEQRPRAVTRARRAAMIVLAREASLYEGEPAMAPDEEVEQVLLNFEDDLLIAMLEAGRPREHQGEDEFVVVEGWTITRDALQTVLDGLRPEQRLVLEQVYAQDYDLKSLAEIHGVNYWTLLDRYHDTIKLMRARLQGLGVDGSPARLEQPWGLFQEKTVKHAAEDGETRDSG